MDDEKEEQKEAMDGKLNTDIRKGGKGSGTKVETKNIISFYVQK